jgi:hypothetical protein
MKKTIVILTAGCALIATLAHHYAKPVMAQVRAAITQNIDERGRNPYLQQSACSQDSIECTITFPAVPANTRLVVEHVNVIVNSATPLAAVYIYQPEYAMSPLLTLQGKDGSGNNIYVANQPFLTYYSAGQTPIASVDAQFAQSGGYYVGAVITLTGYLVNLNN